MFEELHTTEGDNPTIGIVLCAEKDQALVKYSLLAESKHIFASKYKSVLPTTEELKLEVERELRFQKKRELGMKNKNLIVTANPVYGAGRSPGIHWPGVRSSA